MAQVIKGDRVARYVDWTEEVQSDEGRHRFLQELKACGSVVEYAKGHDIPGERVGAFLVEHAELNEQAKEMLLAYTNQLAADVVAIADELVTEQDVDKRALLRAAAKLRSEARKWLASKWNRPVYGDAVTVQHQGETVVRLTFGEARPALVGQSVVVDEEREGEI